MRHTCGIINIRKPEEILKFQYNVTKMPQDNLIEKRGFCGIFQEETMYLVNALNVIDGSQKAVIGKDSCVEMVMMAILARGHILIEDIPGVGKTTMALAFSRACACHEPEPCAVHTGCAAGRYHRIFHFTARTPANSSTSRGR